MGHEQAERDIVERLIPGELLCVEVVHLSDRLNVELVLGIAPLNNVELAKGVVERREAWVIFSHRS